MNRPASRSHLALVVKASLTRHAGACGRRVDLGEVLRPSDIRQLSGRLLVHRLLRSLQVLYERVDAFNGEWVKTPRHMLAVTFDFDADLSALVTHGSPLESGGSMQHSRSPTGRTTGSTIFGHYHISPVSDIKSRCPPLTKRGPFFRVDSSAYHNGDGPGAGATGAVQSVSVRGARHELATRCDAKRSSSRAS
jgi:hypothetical protein